MLGIHVGANISSVNEDTIEITLLNRETGEIVNTTVSNTRFIKRLFRHRKWWNKEFTIDKVSFGVESLKDI